MNTHKDQEFLEFMAKSIVSKPEEVKVERIVDEMGVLLILKVDTEDISKVIGKAGRTAKAMRLMLSTVGYMHKVRANLKIDAPLIENKNKIN